MSDRIKLRVLSAMLHHGRRVEVDSILTVDAAEAADMLDGPKVKLMDPADLAAVAAARRTEVNALMRNAHHLVPPAEGPWFTVH